jgi:hypothetical protein
MYICGRHRVHTTYKQPPTIITAMVITATSIGVSFEVSSSYGTMSTIIQQPGNIKYDGRTLELYYRYKKMLRAITSSSNYI